MRSCLIEELYPLLIVKTSIENPLKPFNEDIIDLFTCKFKADFDKKIKVFKRNNEDDNLAKFIAKVFKIVSQVAMGPSMLVMIEKREANYSSYLIDPLMKIVGSFSENKTCYYQIGEYKLEAIN